MRIKRSSVPRLTLTSVREYLLQHQWNPVASQNPNAEIYHGPLDIYGKPLVAVLPAREDLIDAERRLNDVVRMLSTLEAKPLPQLAREIVGNGTPQQTQQSRIAKTPSKISE